MIKTTNNMISSLQLVNVDVSSWDLIIVYILTQKMNDSTIRHWEDLLQDSRELPSLKHLLKFLEGRIIIESTISCAIIRKESINFNRSSSQSTPTISMLNQWNSYCQFSNNTPHRTQDCSKYKRSNTPEKLELLKKHNLCINCLGKHSDKDCTSTFKCKDCK